MPIVRSDKRTEAQAALAEVRAQLRGLLLQADALQATTEGLELSLGLASEGEQANRAQYLVLHYRKGDSVGHPLEDCTDECAGEESIIDF